MRAQDPSLPWLQSETMIHHHPSLPCSDVLDEAARSPNGGWNAWLESAETVLRGGAASGPFLIVADEKQRRFLASALMLCNAGAETDWKRWVCITSCDKSLRRSDFEPHGRFAPDRHVASVPNLSDLDARCWQRFFMHPYGSMRQRYRLQAAAAFPFLVAVTVLVAHSEDRWLRVRAAWEVIDCIDRGEPLVSALRAFLHIGKAEVRASRHCAVVPPMFGAWTRVRRMLRAVVKLPVIKRTAKSAEWETAFQHLGPLATLLRRSPATLARAYPPNEQTINDLHALRLANPRARTSAWCRVARSMAKQGLAGRASSLFALLPKATFHGTDPAESWSEEDRHQAHGEVRLIELPDGWTAKAMVTIADLEGEGQRMHHCIGDYAESLRQGDGLFFALRWTSGNEAVTLRVVPCELDEPDVETPRNLRESLAQKPIMAIEIAGEHNVPVSIASLRAMVNLVERLWPSHRFCFI